MNCELKIKFAVAQLVMHGSSCNTLDQLMVLYLSLTPSAGHHHLQSVAPASVRGGTTPSNESAIESDKGG